MLRLLFAKINSVSSKSYRPSGTTGAGDDAGGAWRGGNQSNALLDGGGRGDVKIGGPFGLSAAVPDALSEDD